MSKKDDEGHKYVFSVGEMPWHREDEEEIESKPYLEEVRDCLMMIMSERYSPQVVWTAASWALRLIDTNEKK